MSWAKDESNLVTLFTGREQLSELWAKHTQPMNNVTMLDPPFAQLNLDSPQHALSDGYRVWGVKVTLGYKGNHSSFRDKYCL